MDALMVGNWDEVKVDWKAGHSVDVKDVMLGMSMEILMVEKWAVQMVAQWVEATDTLRVGHWVESLVA